MTTARLMDRSEDLERLGLEAGVVRTWEDGRRDTDEPMHNEVWYFDATADDGTKIVVGFRPKLPGDMAREVSSPNLNINVIAPDGQEFVDFIEVDPADAEMADDRCHVRYCRHYVTGNLREYHVVVAPVNGVGVDLRYEALVEPFRPGGTAHVALGADDEYYYTDFSIPRNRVTGTVTAGGRTWEITGSGYHDHQWMNIHPFVAWHHWLWGRFYGERFTAVIYDFTTSERFGFTNIPILGVMDAAGKLVLDNRQPVERTIESYHDERTGKDYPKRSHYVFRDGDVTATLDIEWVELIEFRDTYGDAERGDRYGMSGEGMKARYDQMGIQPTYMRYYATATLRVDDGNGTTSESGDMIYEFNYIGRPDPRAGI